MHIRLDTLGGIAGDMFIAAMLDARPDLADETLAAIRAVAASGDRSVAVIEARDSVLRGKRFVTRGDENRGSHAEHASYRSIVRDLRAAALEPGVCDEAIAIFTLLAEAEAEVHGVAPDDVTFHEVGAWDSIADVVGAAHVLHALKPVSWSVGPIPTGSGRVVTAHGPMPVPAPAVAHLLAGFALSDDGIEGERVTPTGAAILSYLRKRLGAPLRVSVAPMRLARTGMGFGTAELAGISNVLRVLLFDEAVEGRVDDRVGAIHFEIDDQTAEDLAVGLDALRSLEGVLDVLQVAALGKKGRMTSQVQVLCRQDALDRVIEACFAETTTIGLRWSMTERAKLARRVTEVDAGGQNVSVKLVERPGGKQSAKMDIDDAKEVDGHRERSRKRCAAETSALSAEPGAEP